MTFEKKYADAYREVLVSENPPKWTSSSTLKSQERKVHSLMELFSEAKLTVESFLEQFVKTGVNMMDLTDDGKLVGVLDIGNVHVFYLGVVTSWNKMFYSLSETVIWQPFKANPTYQLILGIISTAIEVGIFRYLQSFELPWFLS